MVKRCIAILRGSHQKTGAESHAGLERREGLLRLLPGAFLESGLEAGVNGAYISRSERTTHGSTTVWMPRTGRYVALCSHTVHPAYDSLRRAMTGMVLVRSSHVSSGEGRIVRNELTFSQATLIVLTHKHCTLHFSNKCNVARTQCKNVHDMAFT